jgi:PKD repeat protein
VKKIFSNKKIKSILLLIILINVIQLSYFLKFITAAIPQYEKNYDVYDGSGAIEYIYYDSTYYWNNSIRVEYNMGKGPCIITGLRMFYGSYMGSSGSHDTRIQFIGDTQKVNWLVNDLPYMQPKNWYTLIYSGPTYLIDNDPDIAMIGLEPLSNSFYVWMDSPGYNHSYRRSIVTGQWDLVENYEYMIEARYEQVENLTLSQSKSGSITSTDYIDAYFVNLTKNFYYNFTLNVTSGTGNLNMRLVSYQELTNDVLNSTIGIENPEYLTYIPSNTDKYILLIEPETKGVDIADYSISYTENKVPMVDFAANYTKILVNDYIQFNFTGDSGDLPATYSWNFGDGTPFSNAQNPIHQYSSPGNFTVRLNVTDDDGDKSSETKIDYITVEIDSNPIADFIANTTNIFVGEYVQFTYTGIGGNLPLAFQWNFGDGSPLSNEQNPVHQYASLGNFTVSLNVTDNDGDKSSKTMVDYITVEIDSNPVADFIANVTSVFVGDYIQFSFIGSSGDLPATYSWNFGDGSPLSNEQNPVHQYVSPDNFTVSLNVTDNDGDKSSKTKINYITVEIDTSPITDFIGNTTNIFVGDYVEFTFIGTGGDLPLSYEWNFGDGTPLSNEQDPMHQYTSPGNFTVSLNVTDNDGDESIETKIDYITVEIDSNPIADFLANTTNIFVGEYIQFTYTGIGGNLPLTFQWNFGDGSPLSNEQNPMHQFLIQGEFSVRLTIRDLNGDLSNKTLIIRVTLSQNPNNSIISYNPFLLIGFTFILVTGIIITYSKKRS